MCLGKAANADSSVRLGIGLLRVRRAVGNEAVVHTVLAKLSKLLLRSNGRSYSRGVAMAFQKRDVRHRDHKTLLRAPLLISMTVKHCSLMMASQISIGSILMSERLTTCKGAAERVRCLSVALTVAVVVIELDLRLQINWVGRLCTRSYFSAVCVDSPSYCFESSSQDAQHPVEC